MGKGLWLPEARLAGAGLRWRRGLLIRANPAVGAGGPPCGGGGRAVDTGATQLSASTVWLRGTTDSKARQAGKVPVSRLEGALGLLGAGSGIAQLR